MQKFLESDDEDVHENQNRSVNSNIKADNSVVDMFEKLEMQYKQEQNQEDLAKSLRMTNLRKTKVLL